MNEVAVNKMEKALFMERPVMGVKLIAYKKEFDAIDVPYCSAKRSFCGMVQQATSKGSLLKCNADSFSCAGGGSALGILPQHNPRLSGRSYQASKMYSTLSIAHNVNESMLHIGHFNYGVLVGPLTLMDDCDIVIMLGTSRQIMRIMQGYTYHYGAYEGLKSVGMQALCSDLVSRPFNTNNINISLMCCGARNFTHAKDGEMGIAVPVHMYEKVSDGVVQTINYMEHAPYKHKLEEAYDCQKELGITLNYDVHYGKEVDNYLKYCAECMDDDTL